MDDPNLNNLLRWGIENSDASRNDPTAQVPREAGRLNPETLAALLGGPSDADRMCDAMAAIQSPDVDLENKLTAWDNFEQLIENIDNANNMEQLKLWTPLIDQLQHHEADCRRMASWCVGTAVQNNARAQERLHAYGAMTTLVSLATRDEDQGVRKKAILALSSAARNYQPNMNAMLKALPAENRAGENVDAADMEAVDVIIQRLRDESAQKG